MVTDNMLQQTPFTQLLLELTEVGSTDLVERKCRHRRCVQCLLPVTFV